MPAVPGVTPDVLWTVQGQAAAMFRVTWQRGSSRDRWLSGFK